jgi:FixJ family two-component response regulator
MDSKITLQRILILDDDSDYRKLLLAWLGSLFPNVEAVEYDPASQGIPDENFNWSAYDVLLLDYNLRLDDATGLNILQNNYSNDDFPPTIMLTGAGSEDVAVRAFKYEVKDYLRKEWVDKEQLGMAVENAFIHKILQQQRANLLDEARQVARAESDKIIAGIKLKYIQEREQAQKKLQFEQQNIETELRKNQEILEKIEREQAQIEKAKHELTAELEELKNKRLSATDRSSARIDNQLDSTHERLAVTKSDLDKIKQEQALAQAAIEKIRWKQDQGIVFQQQLEDDLAAFNEELEQQNLRTSDLKARVKVDMLEKMIDLKKKKIDEIKTENELLNDISSQLQKDK